MNRGFTLVELSIVLVIIGLLIGGILAAQSMIGTAKIQTQIRQFQQFDVMITNFHTKFNQIPGDCNSACPGVLAGDGTYHHGNNDGKFEDGDGYTPPSGFIDEAYNFFIDLYNMGISSTPYASLLNGNGLNFSFGAGNQAPTAAIGRGGLIMSTNATGDLFYTFAFNGFTGNQTNGLLGFYWSMLNGNFSPC